MQLRILLKLFTYIQGIKSNKLSTNRYAHDYDVHYLPFLCINLLSIKSTVKLKFSFDELNRYLNDMQH
jgi:hypothetical protein